MIELKCKKCPGILGDTYCNHHKKEVWRENEMCEDGYVLRIKKGIDLLTVYYLEKGMEDKFDKIIDQIIELDSSRNEIHFYLDYLSMLKTYNREKIAKGEFNPPKQQIENEVKVRVEKINPEEDIPW